MLTVRPPHGQSRTFWCSDTSVSVWPWPAALFCQSLVHQTLWLSWSQLKETARWLGTRRRMPTATRPLSTKATAPRRPATPPATTAPTTACVATRTWCPCPPSTGLAAARKGRSSTIPPVSDTSPQHFESFCSGCDHDMLTCASHVSFSALLSRGGVGLRGEHWHSGDNVDGLPGGTAVRDSSHSRLTGHPVQRHSAGVRPLWPPLRQSVQRAGDALQWNQWMQPWMQGSHQKHW